MGGSSLPAGRLGHPAYAELRAKLDEFPLGAPLHESLDQILAELFSPEEAAVAARLPVFPTPLPELAERLGMESEKLKAMCESMADRGLVFAVVRDGVSFYSLLPLVPGIAEMQFMKAERTPLTMRLARLFNTYYYAGWGASLSRTVTPAPRVITVERQIPAEVEVLPYEKASELLRAARSIGLANCYCRHEANLIGEGCGAPLDVCLVLGRFADFCIERGFARRVDVDGALEALDRAEEAGLVHLTENCQERVNFICNCCGCCCGLLRGITKLDRPNAVAHSGYIVALDADECAACGACVERCHVRAIRESDDSVAVDFERCIGCGVCNLVCPTGALTMRRREAVPATPRTWRDLQMTLLSEKNAGKGD
ncbi:MAG: 4Fe-4S dicluster domain-containing protein [Bacillota bacterium]|jgi:Pyruvate/2-oxoacid:ferredoxin oxidoreductase delta subunit